MKIRKFIDIKCVKHDFAHQEEKRVNLNNSRIIFIPIKSLIKAVLIVSVIMFFVFGSVKAPIGQDFFIQAAQGNEERALLKAQLVKYENQIFELEKTIVKHQGQERTLKSEINRLNAKISKINIQIRAINLNLIKLEQDIDVVKSQISQTKSDISLNKERLSNILQTIYENESKNLMEILLKNPRMSDFFGNLNNLLAVQDSLRISIEKIVDLRQGLVDQKEFLALEQVDVIALKNHQNAQRFNIRQAKAEKDNLLAVTRGQESKYKKFLVETKKRATEIRTRIFELVDVPDAPTFGEALELAQWVEQKTGIRPAFLLAIITQESALGRNVGRCYLRNFKTGEGVHVKTGRKMPRTMAPGPPHHPTRNDVAHFLNITKELNRDPKQTLISCPMSFGWGGAMGPAQFIPSTWMGRLSALEQFIENPDPWNVRHAFLASALYLKHLGGHNNEFRAAMRYFSGHRWTRWEERNYGGPVIKRTNCLQVFIDRGTMTRACERMIFIPR